MIECYNVCVSCATEQTVYHTPQSIVHVGTCESEISVRIESRIESEAAISIRFEPRIDSADSRLQLQC